MTRWGPVVLHLSLLLAALCAATSQVLLAHNSDTIVQALVSLLHWTPYYWGENRFGMLVPLLAAPVQDPALNLILQGVLIAWSCTLATWFLMRLLNDPPEAALACGVALCGLLLLFRPKAALLVLLQSTYITPLALLLGGWFAFTRTGMSATLRYAALFVLSLLSFWVNVANVVFAVIMAALWPRFTLRQRATSVGVLAAANVIATALATLVPSQSYRDLLPLTGWIPALLRLLSNASREVVHLPIILLLLAAGGAVLGLRRQWDARIAIGVGACAQIAVVALSEWVNRNGSDSRYIVPPLFVLVLLAAGVVAWPIASAVSKTHSPLTSFFLAALLITGASVRAFGLPSLTDARLNLEQATRAAAQTFPQAGCTHLIGDYWRVWMTVYHDMLTGHSPRKAVSFRSDAVRGLWDREPQEQRVYCGACADGTIEYFRVQQGVPPLDLSSSEAGLCRWRAH